MTTDIRAQALAAMRDLTVEQSALPSMDAIVKRAGISKGGLIHHFPTRAALLTGLVESLATQSAADFEAHRAGGPAARAWLETSTPESDDLNTFFVMVLAIQALRAVGAPPPTGLSDLARDTTRRMAAELDGELTPLIVRLVGDGLLFNAILGEPIPEADRTALLGHFAPRV